MSEVKHLEWGETPFDRMTKKELIHSALMLYTTLTRCGNIMCDQKSSHDWQGDHLPYWDADGIGGIALQMIKETMGFVNGRYDREEIYKSFFQYADDLLFEDEHIGSGWCVCDKCGRMKKHMIDQIGKSCKEVFGECSECDGTIRTLTWDDLKPIREDKNA